MRQVLQDRSGTTVVRDVPSPPCPVAGVLIRTAFSAISSGTERARVEVSRKSLLGKARERPDLVRQVIDKAKAEGLEATRSAVRRKLATETAVGYSNAGVVIEVGGEAAGLRVGDRVASCGGGHANHAEVCAVPRNLVAKVPESVPLTTASLTTIGAIALHGIRLSGVMLGERVAVIGSGLVGQIACRLLQAQGAEVFALDLDQRRIDYAVENGADHGLPADDAVVPAIDELTQGRGVDRVVVTAAARGPEPLHLAAEIARDRGTLILVGEVPVNLPRAALYDKELELRVSRSYGPGRYDRNYEEHGLDYPIGYVRWTEQRNMEAVLDLQSRGLLLLDDLIDNVMPVEQAEEAYARLTDNNLGHRPIGAIVLSYDQDDHVSQKPELLGRTVHPESQNEPTTSTLRLGLIGPGSFASRILLPAFRQNDVRLEVVGGGSGPSAEAGVRQHGFTRVALTEEAVYSDPEVDAVAITSRHSSHGKLTTSALAAGKHVFCEKPLALTVNELDGVLEVAEVSSRVLAVGFNRRFAPMVQDIRSHLSPVGGPIVATFRVNAGELEPDHWAHDLEQGGGRLLGEGCHFVDTLRYLVGHPVTEVFAVAHGNPDIPLKARDCLAITLMFEDGSIGEIVYVSQGSPRVTKERLEVFGNGERSAILDDYRSLELYTGSKRVRRTTKGQDKGHRAEITAFVNSAQGLIVPVSLEEIANVSYATLAAVRSLEIGAPVLLEPLSSLSD